jgi:hypothetical protein
MNVLRHRLLVIAARRFGRLPEAAQVGSNDRMSLGEFGNDRPPHMACLRKPVQENHRVALAGHPVVDIDSVELGEAAFHQP